ncbi:MAG TPA: hypothetical protein VMU34_12135 [Mycobacterium sp.]|nr:hypothetical protein [Mycobacterium sp.]
MNDDELHKAIFDLMQNHFDGTEQPRTACRAEPDTGARVHISKDTERALQTHQTVVEGAKEWLRARLADDGFELIEDR